MEHQFCLFYKNDKLQFGWIKEFRKNKLIVVPEQGKEFSCAPSRVEYIWKGKSIAIEKEALEHLAEMSQWTIKSAETIELEVIHELCEPGNPYSLDELAENFLDDYENGWLRTALFLRLKSDNRLFQQKKNEFFARSEEEIAELDIQNQRKLEAETKQVVETEWALQLLDHKAPDIPPQKKEHWDQFLHRFTNFIIHLDRSQERDYFCNLFHCQLKDPEKLEKKLLDCLAVTDKAISWGSLVLKRSSVDFQFDSQEIAAAEQLSKVADLNFNNRFNCQTRDQTHLKAYTVDHEDTLDFDDAVSWEEADDGYIIRVHITDVASLVPDSSLLFDKASDRISSLYTIKKTFPMFPKTLSEGLFSLKQKETRGVLTFEFSCDLDGNITNTAIYRSLIQVENNCSYPEIDDLIHQEQSFWNTLWHFCEKQRNIRKTNGSLDLDRYEVKLDISDPDRILIKSIRQNTPASLMIQELAILTNHLAASYAKREGLPCLYRNQPPYTVSKELGENEKPTLRDINIQPARISLEPAGHSALALDCYLQISSPIRRFVDLVNQTIIMNRLGELTIPFKEERLLEWARRGEDIQKEFNQIERKLEDHWKIRFIEQNKDDLYDAQFIRTNRNGKAQIVLSKIQLMLEMPYDSLPNTEIFKVAIDSVNAGYNRVLVRPVQQETTE